MKKITLTCSQCHTEFEKALKEVTRRRKINPNIKFYCSLSCSGKNNVEHLRGMNLFTADSESHQRALKAAASANTRYFGIEKPMSKIMRSCRQRKKECDITVEYLVDLWNSQNGQCALSNIPLSFDAPDYVQQPSIDRIDSSKGYVVGNVQFISTSINLAKSNMSDDRMRELFKLIKEHHLD